MNILILTEGGEKIGFGHITRCVALYEAFEEKGINPELLVNRDSDILNLLRHKNFQRFDWIKDDKRLFEIIKNSNFVVIDSYLAEKSLYDKISEMTDGKMLMIDDYNRIDYPKGIVVNPSIYGDKLDYLRKSDAIYLLGKDYIILRKEFWNILKKKINKEIKDVLVTFGGMTNHNIFNEIDEFIKKKSYFNFNVINTKNNKLSAIEMLDFMLKADVCISGGGQTTYELARVGVPTIGICLAENQLGNLIGLEKVGFLKFAGWFSDNDLFQKIKENFNKLDYNTRLKMSKASKKYIDGQGVKRILKKILEKIGNYKNGVIKDENTFLRR
ncbi:MAG: UDP-2,4-diacetamido-2,4,6-trideoxy-beta-L-altropyranose hydrolase [Actinobacteria bacterium]|nr:UDP-2,4-diacetamido-2,4,6-trideoxy-beta-L-altropyranose hydrolase [Actinomycetota bacterium]